MLTAREDTPMTCPHCDSMMVELSFQHPDLCDCLSFDGWRCVSCGHLLARVNSSASLPEPSTGRPETESGDAASEPAAPCPIHPAGHSPIE